MKELSLAQALMPLAAIADAYLANELDDEARRFWGKNHEHENQTPHCDIELYAGRGGRELLTLADCFVAKEALSTGIDLDGALEPLVKITRAFHANELDDEARKFRGEHLEHRNETPWKEIELVAGRGGYRLLTLEDAIAGSAARAQAREEARRVEQAREEAYGAA